MKALLPPILLGVSLILSGCVTGSKHASFPLTGDPIVDGQNAVQFGPAKDKVLWQYRMASAAMQRGSNDLARQYLDEALDRVEGAIGYDRSARKARGYFSPEAKKTFIGEPYERVMAYYYRGILYWMNDDLANARASFRSAQVMDSDTGDESFAADYALLDYLDGYLTEKLGGDGSDGLKRAREEAKLNTLPPYSLKATVLFFVDYGPGPVKYATGEYGQELRFRGGVSPVRSARVQVAQKTAPAPPYDDLYFQATTRGGRVMDHILANKAVFKSTTDTAANAALLSGAVVAADRRNAEVGLGLLAFGLIAKAVSASTTPDADIRSWDNLPLFLSFAAVDVPAGEYTATVEFLDAANHVLPNLTKVIHFHAAGDSRDTVIYVSDKSTTPQTI